MEAGVSSIARLKDLLLFTLRIFYQFVRVATGVEISRANAKQITEKSSKDFRKQK